MTVHALSYKEFKGVMEHYKWIEGTNTDMSLFNKIAIIEIMGEQDLLVFPFWFKFDYSNVLKLLFDDVDEPLHIPLLGEPALDEREYVPVVPMSKYQGKKILDFIRQHTHVTNFIVHCAAGISRSAAVALFIKEYFKIDEIVFNQQNPYIKPNMRIVNILRDLNNH